MNDPSPRAHYLDWLPRPAGVPVVDFGPVQFSDVEQVLDREGNVVALRAKGANGGWFRVRVLAGLRSSSEDREGPTLVAAP